MSLNDLSTAEPSAYQSISHRAHDVQVHPVEGGRPGENGRGDQRLDRLYVADDEDGLALPVGQQAVHSAAATRSLISVKLSPSGAPLWGRPATRPSRTASIQYWHSHPVKAEAAPSPVLKLKTPPAHPVTSGKDTNSCPMRVAETQIGFMLGGCLGQGVNIGVNLSEPGDEEGKTGTETGEEGQDGGIIPGQVTKGLEDEDLYITNKLNTQLMRWRNLHISIPEKTI